MAVDIGHHIDLGVAGVSLHGFDVAAVEFELVSHTGMSQTVENNIGEVVFFNQPIDKWNTSNVTDMSEMFCDAEKFNCPVNNRDVSSLEDCGRMFEGADAYSHPKPAWSDNQ